MSPAIRTHKTVTKAVIRLMLLLIIIMPLVSCSSEYDDARSERIKDVNNSDTINIAVIWDKTDKDLLVEGITLAADEINEQGGLFGRDVKIKVYYARNDAHELSLAKKVARNTSFSAVIGHRSSKNAIPASITYNYYGLLFVSPSSSSNNLTNHGFEYIFRTLPADRYVSEDIAIFMKSQGHKNIAIVDDRSVYGKEIADGVMEYLSDQGLKTVIRRQYSPGKTDFKQLCSELLRYNFDAIFLGGALPEAADFIREARQMGIRQRVYGGTAMDSRTLEKIAGKAADGTVVPTSFKPNLDNPETKAFVRNFKKLYRKHPDTSAAIGYDSVKLIIEAMKRSKSVEPVVVASHMRFIKNWQGVTGEYSYNIQGDLIDKDIYFKYLDQTRFVFFDNPLKEEEEEQIQED